MTTAAASLRPADAGGPRPRRFQRFLVGIAMSMVALVLERIVVRAMKKGTAGTARASDVARSGGGALPGPNVTGSRA
jgi:hypothetical protein